MGVGGYEDTNPVPPGTIKPEGVVERAIKEANAFTGKTTKGDATESYSVIVHVQVGSKDAKKYDRRYPDCQQAIIGRVSEMFDANMAEYHKEIGYTTLKEKAKREINEVLGVPYVKSVILSNLTFETQ
jgi:7-cyano-7-deazaguanine synthase in queuosine biosynthesis